MAERVDLDDEADVEFLHLAQMDDAVDDRFPVLVAREIIVGDEERPQALCVVRAHDLLDVFRRATARLAALHVDDGAERALVRAAAAGVEAGGTAGGALRAFDRHQRDRRAFDTRQVVHEIVQRLELTLGRIEQHFVEPAFRLAGEQRDAHRLGAVEIGIDAVEHGQHAGDVEAADPDLDAALAQRLGQIERTRELVRLHAGQHDYAGTGLFDHRGQAIGLDAGIGFVEGMDLNIDVLAQNLALGAVLGQPE